MTARVTYRIDAHDRIVSVGGDWAAFAQENSAPHLASAAVGRPLWEFVAGDTTRYVYRELLGRVRRGTPVTFDYRCDAPALRRFMQMRMRRAEEGGVDFDSVTLRVESRAPVAPALRTGDGPVVRMCSWCNRVECRDTWLELEAAAEQLGLFAASCPPSLSHTMCPTCFARFMGDMDTPQTPAT